MKIVFLSNYFNHHQLPLCEELYQRCDSFCFIATGVMREERRKMGYEIPEPEYVLHAYELGQIEIAKKHIREADVILYGAVQKPLSDPRLYWGKTVFYYSERLFRTSPNPLMLPLRIVKNYFRFRYRQNSYLLGSGAYVAADYAKTRTFLKRSFRWGYFPETKTYDVEALMQKKDRKKILWCGRLLELKHPEYAVETAQRLKISGTDFSMDIIGGGVEMAMLEKMIREYNLSDQVHLLGMVSKDDVRRYMEHAGIFMFTSDRREGWGAVLNEAMNNVCAVVASSSVGAAPYLINNGQNGVIYPDGNVEQLYQSIKTLLQHPEQQETLGSAAYKTITELWNAETAARRFLALAESAVRGHISNTVYQNGPCSRAELLRDNWMNGEC